eukprot:gene3808-405_t
MQKTEWTDTLQQMPESAGGPPSTPRPAQMTDTQLRHSYMRQATTIRELQIKLEEAEGKLTQERHNIPAVNRIVKYLFRHLDGVEQDEQDQTPDKTGPDLAPETAAGPLEDANAHILRTMCGA